MSRGFGRLGLVNKADSAQLAMESGLRGRLGWPPGTRVDLRPGWRVLTGALTGGAPGGTGGGVSLRPGC